MLSGGSGDEIIKLWRQIRVEGVTDAGIESPVETMWAGASAVNVCRIAESCPPWQHR
jgi:hypothetical protein